MVNVVTAGLASKFGGANVASHAIRQGARAVAVEATVGTALGAGTGALTTAMNPNVWESPDTIGLILKGTVVGAVGGAVGALGSAAAK